MPPEPFPPNPSDSTVKMSLIIGSFVHKPLSVDRFDLIAPASQPVAPHPEEVYYHPRPGIEHTFHPGQKAPSAFISTIFSALVFSHWVVLIGPVSPFLSFRRECWLIFWPYEVVATFS